MTSFKKIVMCFGLFAVLSMPLAGCSGTWQGVKNDWHDVTGSNDDGAPASSETAASQEAAPAPAEAQGDAAVSDENSPSAYN